MSKSNVSGLFLFVALAGFTAVTATAEVLTTGSVSLVSSPPAVGLDAFTSDTTIALIHERQAFSLDEPVLVDVGARPGVFGERSFRPVTVPTGTVVDSYLLHFDPVGSVREPVRLSGSVVFDQPVVGLIFSTSLLGASDLLGNPNTVYTLGPQGRQRSPGGPSPYRGFEFGSPTANSVADSVTLAGDLRTVTVNFGATLYSDQLRVLVEVPEPSTFLLQVVVALLAPYAVRRRVHRL